MPLHARSEWMAAQKNADLMQSGQQFDVAQLIDGTSVFLTIGSDDVLYMTHEVPAGYAGWRVRNLSEELVAVLHLGTKLSVSKFCLTQSVKTLDCDLALVAEAGGTQLLFYTRISGLGASSLPETLPWQQVTFDAVKEADSNGFDFAAISIINSNEKPICIVDVAKPGQGDDRLLERYYIRPDHSPAWKKHSLGFTLSVGSVQTQLGRRQKDPIVGAYTLGQINGKTELQYSQLWNPFARPGAETSPTVLSLRLPPRSTAIASALNSTGYSNLFVTSDDGIHVWTPDKQQDDAAPSHILKVDLVSNCTKMRAQTREGCTTIWGLTKDGSLFYTSCLESKEADPSAWSQPVTVLEGVSHFAAYTSIRTVAGTLKHSSQSIFAHVAHGQNGGAAGILQFSQDPVTTNWVHRRLLLPTKDPHVVHEFQAFHTRVSVTDKYACKKGAVPLQLSSKSPVAVYINDDYYVLGPTPITVVTGADGSLNIIQEAETLAAVTYTVRVDSEVLAIQPAEKTLNKLKQLTTVEGLTNAHITGENRSDDRPLLPQDIGAEDRQAAADILAKLHDILEKVPSDGTILQPKEEASTEKGFTVHVKPSESRNIGLDEAQQPNIVANAVTVGDGIGSAIIKAGDFFLMLGQKAWSALRSLEIDIVKGVHRMMAKIGGFVYHAWLDCTAAVLHAFEWVFEKIKVGLKDLRDFLGFLFDWGDIVRTHTVLTTFTRQFMYESVKKVDDLKQSILTMADDLDTKVKGLLDMAQDKTTIGQHTSSERSVAINREAEDPQNHWASQHMCSNLHNTTMEELKETIADKGILLGLLDQLSAFVENEESTIQDMAKSIQDQIFNKIGDMTPLELVKTCLGIVADLAIKTAKNVVVLVFNIVELILLEVIEYLEKPITIPILSPLYRRIAGAELSILDMTCLVTAIPATLLFKLATKRSPFPDTPAMQQVTQAKSQEELLAALKTLPSINPPAPSPRAVALATTAPNGRPTASHAAVYVTSVSLNGLAIAGIVLRFAAGTANIVNQVLNGFKYTNKYKEDSERFAPDKIRYIAPVLSAISATPTFAGMSAAWGASITAITLGPVLMSFCRNVMDCSKAIRANSNWPKSSAILGCLSQTLWAAGIITQLSLTHDKKSQILNGSAGLSNRVGNIVVFVGMLPSLKPPVDLALVAGGSVLGCVGTALQYSEAVMLIKGQ